MIFSRNRKVNSQNYPKSIFLNASIKVEASFLQFGCNYSILLIKSGIFHSMGSNRTVVLTGAKGSNRITLRSLPDQSCQFLLPGFYHYFTIGTKYIVILPMNYHYFTSQSKLHKITSILPKSLVKLLSGKTGK